MFEKVNPCHPDKVADRIAGAIVDMAYAQEKDPKIAVEVLIGHGECNIIAETSVMLDERAVESAVRRITGEKSSNTLYVRLRQFPQDSHLADNQSEGFKCGDNGVFRGCPVTNEQRDLRNIAQRIYKQYGTDGKYIIDGNSLIVCQSNAGESGILTIDGYVARVNPLGDWTGGTNVDSGATNRKLGSDMGDAVTGGGLHGKDLSKADVSVNIYAFLKAQELGHPVEYSCAIGDAKVNGIPYTEIVETAREFIGEKGGFEKFAEWGLI